MTRVVHTPPSYYPPTPIPPLSLPSPLDLAVHHSRHRAAVERPSVEGRVSTPRCRLIHVVGPLDVRAEHRDVARRAWRQRAASQPQHRVDRKSTRLNSSHLGISYA